MTTNKRLDVMVTIVAVVATAALSASGRLLLIDAGHLSAVRERVRAGDAALAPAVDRLEQAAAKALGMKPVSVMDKGVTPPSGDKHDYLSQAPYWWPDPAKADGLPYIQRDGERNPEIRRITDHANFDRLMITVGTLGLAYDITGQERYAEHAARLLRVWFLDAATRMNPHLEYGQGIPGITEGRGIGIIETRMLPEMLDGVLLIRGSKSWSEDDDRRLQAWMRAYLTWLLESDHGKAESAHGNNHETYYDVQVAGLALYTGQRDLARRTLEQARRRADRQLQPDGRQPRELKRTRALHYSLFNLKAFFQLAHMGQDFGVDLWNYRSADGASLRTALDFVVPYVAGEREWPYQQITPLPASESHGLLRTAAVVWNEPRYRALATQIGGGDYRTELTLP